MPRRRSPSVFICYRREGAAFPAAMIRTELTQRWGSSNVFIDLDIPPGDQFPTMLESRIRDADFLLTVIGSAWLTPRLFEPDDWVRREIVIARSSDTSVVPILVDSARMPEPDELPGDIRFVTDINAHHLSHVSWQADIDRLARELERRIPPLPSAWLSASEVKVRRRSLLRALAPEPVLAFVGFGTWAVISSEPMVAGVGVIASAILVGVNLFDRRRSPFKASGVSAS